MYPSSATSIEGIAAVHHAGLTDNLVANTATDTDEASIASVSTKQLVS